MKVNASLTLRYELMNLRSVCERVNQGYFLAPRVSTVLRSLIRKI